MNEIVLAIITGFLVLFFTCVYYDNKIIRIRKGYERINNDLRHELHYLEDKCEKQKDKIEIYKLMIDKI